MTTRDPVDLSEEYRAMLEVLDALEALDAYSERVGQQWRVFANVGGPYGSLPYYCEIGGETFGAESYGLARAKAAAWVRAQAMEADDAPY